MLFEQRYGPGIADGTITLTFRRWKRSQVVAGRRYRTAAGVIEVEAVDIVDASSISDAAARRAGHASASELVADLRGPDDLAIYRVQFHGYQGPDPRADLAAADDLSDDDVSGIDRRLERLDRAAADGPWTMATLDLIAAHPERRAGDLAELVGRERDPFKLDVRKLKNLGLTLSLLVGYRLSPRGEAYRARTTRR